VFDAVAFFHEAEAETVFRVQLVEKSKSKMKCPPTLSDASLDHKVHNRNTNEWREMALSEVAPFILALAFEHGLSEIIDHREIQLYTALHVVFNSFGMLFYLSENCI
ncbi:hypothetical protein Tco_1350167, partial [Tanacetum coccineum]